MFFTPGGNPPRLISSYERAQLQQFVHRQQYEIQVLQNSTWESGYGNLTGLQEYPINPAEPGSIFPDAIYSRARDIWSIENENKNENENENENENGNENGDESRLISNDDGPTYYHNVSGFLRGEWKKMDVDLVPINMTTGERNKRNETEEVAPYRYQREFEQQLFSTQAVGNVTVNSGQIAFALHEVPRKIENYNVTLMDMSMDIMDQDGDNGQTINLQGIHIRDTGNVVLSTSSLKFSGIQALPHFIITARWFEESRDLIVKWLNITVSEKSKDQDYAYYEESLNLAHECEYIVFGHIHSSGLPRNELDEIENELEQPSGRPHSPVPPLKLDAVLYSPDCAMAMMTSSSVKGERYEVYYQRMRWAVINGILLLLSQTIFMAIQMKDTSTPSTLSRISFYSIALMAVIDGAICMASLVSSFIESVALPFMAVAFIAFALTSLFEMRYMVLIYRSQLLEPVADAHARAVTESAVNGQATFIARPDGTIAAPSSGEQSPQTNSNSNSPAPGSTFSTPPPPPPAAPPAPVPPPVSAVDQDERQIMGMVYSRFYFTLLGFLIISLSAASWPLVARRIYEYIIMGLLYSFWIPQVYRNVVRGSRKSFLWKYIIATSIIRIIPVLYLCLDMNNVVHHHYDPTLAFSIAIYLWLQICVLAAQTIFGPRFFLPKGIFSTLYDYHPIITEDDLESGFTFGEGVDTYASSDTSSGSHEEEVDSDDKREQQALLSSKPKIDCAICMMPVELVILPKGGTHIASTPSNILARRKYMVTPCRHVFHTECMETWMRTRLQCPVCRNPLPPI